MRLTEIDKSLDQDSLDKSKKDTYFGYNEEVYEEEDEEVEDQNEDSDK